MSADRASSTTDEASSDLATTDPTVDSRRSPWRWWSGYLIVFGLLALWSLATPNYAAPDEPVQAYRAASLVRGEILGQDVSSPGDPSVRVSVPRTLVSYSERCFAFKVSVAASCMPEWIDHPGLIRANTYTGRYPPLYYVAVGLPSLLDTGPSMLLWMRLAGDLVNALFLTVAFVMITRLRPAWWALAGGAVAVSPMVLFIGSVVNPSGLEICSAIAFWCCLLSWAKTRGGPAPTSTVGWATASAVVFESTRGLSPLFMCATVVAVGFMAGWRRAREVIGSHQARVAAVIVAAFGLVAVGWIVFAGALRLARTAVVPADVSTASIIGQALDKNSQFAPFVGDFGWLDTPAPAWVVYLWMLLTAVLVAAVAASRAWRSLIAIALLIAATIVIPTVGDVLQAHTIGMVSQARYIQPLAVGVALIAGFAVKLQQWWSRPAAHVLIALLALAHVGAFLRALQRYRTGLGVPAANQPEWSPPLGATTLIIGFPLLIAALQVWFLVLTRRADERWVRRPVRRTH